MVSATTASPPRLTRTGFGPLSDSDHGAVIGRLPSDGFPLVKAKVTETVSVPGAGCRTNDCDVLVPARTAPTCHVPWRSRGPVPASRPLPDAVEYTTTPLRSAASARATSIFPAPSPSGPT